MSQIRIPSLALGLLLALSLTVLSGCGDKNPRADLDSTSGKHPASWLPAGHSVAAKSHAEACTECHGSDFSGGISNIACTQCHLGNAEAPHPIFWNYTSTKPTAWGTYAYAFHGAYAIQKGTASCAVASCHGTALTGVANSGPSCTKCHLGGPTLVHPANWIVQLTKPGNPPHAQVPTVLPDHGPYVIANGTAACLNTVCHGAQGQGVFLSGPACTMCHF